MYTTTLYFQKITILRDPATNFISSWRYYRNFNIKLRQKLPLYKSKNFNSADKDPDIYTEIEQFLNDPEDYLGEFNYEEGPYMFLFQPQFVFFGYPTYLIRSIRRSRIEALVKTWIWEIANDFDHILITERMNESLAIMMIKVPFDF